MSQDTQTELKKTPLHAVHQELKAKMAPFGGWHMPIQFSGVKAEHKQVREKCGLFDVSHMGEVFVKGPDAEAFLQYATINNCAKLSIGDGQYTAMLNDDGGMLDDFILYRTAEQEYLVCVNAANRDKDVKWLQNLVSSADRPNFSVDVIDESDSWSQIAIQGPKSQDVLTSIVSPSVGEQLAELNYMQILPASFFNKPGWIARTGYTGEFGYEIYVLNEVAGQTWNALLDHPEAAPIGLGARDTLRLEAGLLLYGNDMDETVSPVEAGISWAIKKDGTPFVGADKVKAHLDSNNTDRRKMVAFVLEDKGIARHGMDVYKGDTKIGVVTSGSFLPTLDQAGGMALIGKTTANINDQIEVDVRGKRKLAKIMKRPLYSPRVK
jgi:aminomethyltransferase